MGVLSFAAVGFHGREWRARLAPAALALATLSAPASAQPSGPFLDLAADFASAIAAAVGPDAAVAVVFPPDQERVRAEVVRLLASRGVRSVQSGDASRVAAECSTNLRERVCAAEIRRGDDRRVVMTTRARDRNQDAEEPPAVAIELRPLYAQRRPMLDVAEAGDRLLVLTSESVSLMANEAGVMRALASRAIATSRVWPRDLRGRLRAAGQSFEAFLPGVTCRGTVAPFTLACADESEPWPIGLENTGIAPSRNAFATPDGFVFYEAAPLGGGRWLVVGERGALTFLDARGRTAAPADPADHAAGLPESCAGDGAYVVTGGRSPEANVDALRLLHVVDARLVALPSTAPLPGTLTALWSAPAGGPATAIVHDATAGRYEALHVSVSCAR
jgi:hypothetical protein